MNISVLIPVNEWLRRQLNTIEQYIQQHVTVKDISSSKDLLYRPIWGGENMYLRVARWCNVLRQNPATGNFDSIPIDAPLGPGSYNVTVEVPYVYIGPHKNGEDFSLSISVVQIVYKPTTEPIKSFTFKQLESSGEAEVLQGFDIREQTTAKTTGRRKKNAGQTQDVEKRV
jgi:hypothetical protein